MKEIDVDGGHGRVVVEKGANTIELRFTVTPSARKARYIRPVRRPHGFRK